MVRPLVAFAVGLVAACGLGSTFACEQDHQCGPDGTCQPEGWCSFPDGACPSGERFGEHSGDGLGGSCVSDASDTSGAPHDSTGAITLDDDGAVDPTTSGTTGADVTDASTSMSLDDGAASTSVDEGVVDTGMTESTGAAVEPPDPIAWYSFDDELEPFEDVSGNEHHGSCADLLDECPVAAAGVVGLAGSFDGVDHGHVEHGPWLETTEALSISVWVAPTDIGGEQMTIVSKALGSIEANSWDLALSDTVPTVEAGIESIDVAVLAVGEFPYDGQWHHVAMVWDAAELRVYVDGVEVDAAVATEISFDEHPLTIGADINYEADAGQYFGLMDELRIFDVALSEQDVATLAAR